MDHATVTSCLLYRRKKEMTKTIRYVTGRIYDGPQILEITEVEGGWHFVDESRHLDGDVSDHDFLKEFYKTDREVGACVLSSYDEGDYQ
jgi:hypothetical protein